MEDTTDAWYWWMNILTTEDRDNYVNEVYEKDTRNQE